MVKFIVKRILLLIPIVLGVIFIVTALMTLTPSDPVELHYTGTTEEFKEQKREELGLNDPFLIRYFNYVKNFVTKGDLGTSFMSGKPVTQELLERFPITLLLTLISIGLALLVGIPLGVWSAVKQYSILDNFILMISTVAASFPNFWLALLLIMLLSVNLGWLPTGGILSWKGWIMPVIVTAFGSLSQFVRITRSSMLEVIRQDFVRTARAKGQKAGKITRKHVLRNALIPIITQVAGQLGMSLGGALIVESIFSMPGIGMYMVAAINNRNYPSVIGGVVLLAIVYSIINLIVDIVYTIVDPRVKLEMIGRKKPKKRRNEAPQVQGEVS